MQVCKNFLRTCIFSFWSDCVETSDLVKVDNTISCVEQRKYILYFVILAFCCGFYSELKKLLCAICRLRTTRKMNIIIQISILHLAVCSPDTVEDHLSRKCLTGVSKHQLQKCSFPFGKGTFLSVSFQSAAFGIKNKISER